MKIYPPPHGNASCTLQAPQGGQLAVVYTVQKIYNGTKKFRAQYGGDLLGTVGHTLSMPIVVVANAESVGESVREGTKPWATWRICSTGCRGHGLKSGLLSGIAFGNMQVIFASGERG